MHRPLKILLRTITVVTVVGAVSLAVIWTSTPPGVAVLDLGGSSGRGGYTTDDTTVAATPTPGSTSSVEKREEGEAGGSETTTQASEDSAASTRPDGGEATVAGPQTYGPANITAPVNPAAEAGAATSTTAPPSTTSTTNPEQIEEVPVYETTLVVGTDSRAGLDTEFYGDIGGNRPDGIILIIAAEDGPQVVSLPRDLVVTDACTGELGRINASYRDCEDYTAAGRLVATIEATTGVEVHHMAAVDMAGFISVIDQLGGYPVTVPYPTRDRGSKLDLEAGSSCLGGPEALAWVRSRKAEEYRDGEWRPAAEERGDIARTGRQRELVTWMAANVASQLEFGEVVALYRDLTDHVAVSAELTVSKLWDLKQRLGSPSGWQTAVLPVEGGWLGESSVVYPTVDPQDWFEARLTNPGDSAAENEKAPADDQEGGQGESGLACGIETGSES